MKATILRATNHVVVDGVPADIDCSHLPSYVSVVQWDGETKDGWIEFVQDGKGAFLPNMKIADLGPYRFLLDAWAQSAVTKAEGLRAEAHDAGAKAKAETGVASQVEEITRPAAELEAARLVHAATDADAKAADAEQVASDALSKVSALFS